MKPTHIHVVVAATLTACSQDFEKQGPVRPVGDSGERCDVTVDETWPAVGSDRPHYYRDPVEFWLSEPDESAVVEAPVAGSTEVLEDGHLLRFQPDPVLEPDAPYTFGLSYCGGRPRLSFQTSPAGLPVSEEEALAGQVWLVKLGEGRFVEGGSVGDLLNGVFGRALLLGVTEINGNQILARAGVTTTDFREGRLEQDPCFRTVDFELPTSLLPDFSFAAEHFSFMTYDTELTLASVEVFGTVHPEGIALDGVEWAVTVQASELAALLPGIDSASETCEFASDLGVECEPCPSDAGDECITVAADRVRADSVSLDFVAITDANRPESCSE